MGIYGNHGNHFHRKVTSSNNVWLYVSHKQWPNNQKWQFIFPQIQAFRPPDHVTCELREEQNLLIDETYGDEWHFVYRG